ncbi:MAG: hypothetical protein IJ711_11115 [Lachnospiraceae bacterium]|nr:hypothetical protein [Lachnospiraceae bacterium]
MGKRKAVFGEKHTCNGFTAVGRLCAAVMLLLVLTACSTLKVHAEKLETLSTTEEFYDKVVTMVEQGRMQEKFIVLFDPAFINPQEIRGHAFERGGYALEAKFSHWSYSWRQEPEGVVVSFKTGYFLSSNQDKQVEAVAEAIAKDCQGKTDYEKIKYAYDYIILNCEYDLNKDGAYNNLIRGRSCCNGYAEAFLTIMDKMNIPCKYTVNSSHAWNTVYLNGAWYNIDTTWGDAGGDQIDYTYFLKSNEDWEGMGPTEATAMASFPAKDLELRAHYPNYTLLAKLKTSAVLIVPLVVLLLVIYLLRAIGGQKTRNNIAKNEERIRNLYKLPDE